MEESIITLKKKKRAKFHVFRVSKYKEKIIKHLLKCGHIIAIILFISGLIIVHVVMGSKISIWDNSVNFFGVLIDKGLIIDLGIVFLIIGFIYELYLNTDKVKINNGCECENKENK